MCLVEGDNVLGQNKGCRSEDAVSGKMWDFDMEVMELYRIKEELNTLKKDLEEKEKKLNQLKSDFEIANESLEKERALFEAEKSKFKRSCALEKERLGRENDLLELKFKKLEAELFSLANEKEKLARDRERLQIERSRMSGSVSICYDDAGKLFFYGAMDEAEIKTRYRSLLKIYHPDNTGTANNLAIRIINHEYERLRGIHRSLNGYNR